jgi:tetratricopeptide (TPR) repeat protein
MTAPAAFLRLLPRHGSDCQSRCHGARPPDLVADLYHEALQRPPEERDAFLSNACAGDEALRRDVQSLLGYESAAEHFLETPAIADAALANARRRTVTEPSDAFVPPSYRLAPGTMVGRYQIEALVGVGGMGEVYRAQDTRLGRTIALKTLPAHLRANRQRQVRFEREARAVARLRHPHICTLYDVGHHEGLDFLVMEYVAGETLAARLRSGPLALDETLRLTSEVASALGVISGDVVDVQSRLLTKLRETFAPEGTRARPGSNRAPPAKLPTPEAEAFMAYVEARALLDRPEESGNIQRAEQLFDRGIGIDSRFALAHAGLADALRVRYATERDGKVLERAMQSATTAVQLDADSSAAHVSFAAIQNQLNQKQAAVTSLHRALDLQPDNDDAHRWLGEILADQNQVDAGVAELRAALRIRPSFTNYSRLGAVLFKAGRYPAAIEAYEKALDVRPNHGGTYEMLGATHDMLGHLDQAIGNYEHAIRVGATATAYSNLAMAYFGAGAYEKSRTAALNAIARDPNKPTLYRTLGDIYLKLNRQDDARASYDKAIAMSRALLAVNPKDAFSIVLIAVCEANLGRSADAERHAVEALALQPTNRGILYRVAKVYALTGNRPAAFKALRGAIEQGYDREAARRDPELASLRSSPEFEKVLSDEVRR